MAKVNTLAEEASAIALRQLQTSYQFKLPRIAAIRRFRSLYNNQTAKQLRVRYNVPIPIFAGMIDTLQAGLDDSLLLKYQDVDPADFKAAEKLNAYVGMESQSMRPGAQWNKKFRQFRQEMIFTGRGIVGYSAGNDGGFTSDLTNIPFEDFFFEPKGGGQLENHLFCGRANIWKTAKQCTDGVKAGIYDKGQVDKLISFGNANTYKASSYWDNYDFANRFLSLNLSPEGTNYVGEPVYQFVEWGMTLKGIRWYLLMEAFSGLWIRFDKLSDVNSSDLWPWMSAASHEDSKNFASKGFADDIYPISVAATDLFNEDLENRKRINSNARGYDKDMVVNVKHLDEAMMGRDRLVAMDTKGGTRRISDGIYQFQTPQIQGNIEVINWLESMSGRNFGVSDLQKGGDQPATKKVGVIYAQQAQVSDRLSYESQPFIEVGQELGMRVFGGLKDYLREPLAIKLLGEDGYEWDVLKRIDLNIKKNFEIAVTSQAKENKNNETARQAKFEALAAVRDNPAKNPGINARMADEQILRNGGWKEAEITLLLDTNTRADKNTIAETSLAIQMLMNGKVPPINYNATGYFMQRILDFVKTHQGDKQIARHYKKFLDYIMAHEQIAAENERRRAEKDMQQQQQQQPMPGQEQPQPM